MQRLFKAAVIACLAGAIFVLGEEPARAEAAHTAIFDHYDSNKDGKVSIEEMGEYVVKVKQDVFKAADKDGDESLDHEEFPHFLENFNKNEEL
mmetsp:Transcript_77887/g.147084  ORF Transcript_77887/g.147084 Transcript_77887/m.147084 type:complete len:93 (+) Transcript_77887:50-328(+)